MPMVADISKSLGKDFLIGSFVPASLLVGTNVLYARWKLLPPEWFRDWTVVESKSVAILSAMFGAALGLSMLRTFIYRSFEGYERQSLVVGGAVVWLVGFAGQFWIRTQELQWAAECCRWGGGVAGVIGLVQYATLRHHRRKHEELMRQKPSGVGRYRFARRYPEDPSQVLATSFGNVLRAFEEYPWRLYGIDPISTWPRLVSVLPDGYLGQIADSKMVVTFFLNVCVVGLSLVCETALVSPSGDLEKWFGAALGWAAIAAVAYQSSKWAAGVWGEYFRGAFDLYRLDLLRRMCLELPTGPMSGPQEQEVWQRVQLITFFAEESPELRVVVKESPVRQPEPSTTGLLMRLYHWLSTPADKPNQ
jgi:hypothetical protein